MAITSFPAALMASSRLPASGVSPEASSAAAAGYLDGDSFLVVLKAAGIALVAQNMQDVCKDAGLSTLAGKVELAGRCLILVCALPLFENIMGALIAFLQ